LYKVRCRRLATYICRFVRSIIPDNPTDGKKLDKLKRIFLTFLTAVNLHPVQGLGSSRMTNEVNPCKANLILYGLNGGT
jgi:hypothetical protein